MALISSGVGRQRAQFPSDSIAAYGAAGVRWLVTDEGILERSLDRPLRDDEKTSGELYQQWRLGDDGPILFFRDRRLSDAIGFEYGRWEDEGDAAESLSQRLAEIAREEPEEASIVIALDGENPWLHFPEGGGRFLRELFGRLNDSGPELVPATLGAISEYSGTFDSRPAPPRLMDQLDLRDLDRPPREDPRLGGVGRGPQTQSRRRAESARHRCCWPKARIGSGGLATTTQPSSHPFTTRFFVTISLMPANRRVYRTTG